MNFTRGSLAASADWNGTVMSVAANVAANSQDRPRVPPTLPMASRKGCNM